MDTQEEVTKTKILFVRLDLWNRWNRAGNTMVGTMVRAETEAGRKWREDPHDPPELDFVPLNTLNPTYSLFPHLTWTQPHHVRLIIASLFIYLAWSKTNSLNDILERWRLLNM